MIDRLTVFLVLSAMLLTVGGVLFATAMAVGVADQLGREESGEHLGPWSNCPEGYGGSGDVPRECRTGQVDRFFVRYAVIQRREVFGDFTKFTGTVVGISPAWLRIVLTLVVAYLLMEGVCRTQKKPQQPPGA